jgi:CheY-like chemotaxis protein
LDHTPRVDRTVLVVDDDVFVASAIAEFLEGEGYDVHTASNGFSAWRQVSELHPTVLLLDLALPERSGGDLLHDLRADPTTRDTAIVIVTGHPDALSDAQLEQTDGLIAKPYDEADLRAIVQSAITRAAARRAEGVPSVATWHSALAGRPRRATSARRSRGRR